LVFRSTTGLFVFIGVCELVGGVGLILPAMTGVKPKLTPLAAFGLTLIMILAAVFHVARGEYVFVPINLLLGGVAGSSRMDACSSGLSGTR
jgi:DoxX-like family